MTSDELLELETAAIQSIDGELRGPALKAVARIRELEAELEEANAHLHEIEKTYWIEGWSLSKRASWMKKLAEEYLDKTTARAAQENADE